MKFILKILTSCGYSRSQTNASCQPLFPYLPTLLHRIQTTICQIRRTLLDPTTDLKAHTLGIPVVNQYVANLVLSFKILRGLLRGE